MGACSSLLIRGVSVCTVMVSLFLCGFAVVIFVRGVHAKTWPKVSPKVPGTNGETWPKVSPKVPGTDGETYVHYNIKKYCYTGFTDIAVFFLLRILS